MKSYQSTLVLIVLFFALSMSAFGQNKGNYKNKKFVVVVDAGHGGKDPGNRGNGYYEKHIALDVALKVGKALKKHADVKVILTRTTDVFLELKERAEIANQADADLFVSIHCNSYGKSSSPHGTETFVLGTYRNKDNLAIAMKENSVIYLEDDYEVNYDGFDPKSPASYISMTLMQEEYLDQSILLADNIQNEFTNDLKRTNRGVKKAGFLVLRETYMPSVLIEIGFLTNRAEGKYLNSERGQTQIAKAITEGVVDYKNALNLNAYKIEKTAEPSSSDVYKDIVFKVQIAAGSKALKTAPYNFKGLKGVERQKEGNLYRYYYGATADYLKIQNLQKEAVKEGFKSAYIVAFKNGEKISVSKALKHKAQ